MHIKQLWVYPVKSMAGSLLQEAELGRRGFKNDRRWMLVDENGRFISQREYPSLAQWRASVNDDTLVLECLSSHVSIEVPNAKTSSGEFIEVEVWGAFFEARLVDIPEQQLLEQELGFTARLVYMSDDSHRAIDPKFAKEGEEVSFADGYPYLIANTASLDMLANRLGKELDILRFRPNIVVETTSPFCEDDWTKLSIGDHTFRLPKPCSRCIMITIDPVTIEKNPKVMEELASFRRVGKKILFGMNAIWDETNEGKFMLKMNDKVESY